MICYNMCMIWYKLRH